MKSLYAKIKMVEMIQEKVKKENLDIQLAVVELEEKRLESELDIQLALAELVEGGM